MKYFLSSFGQHNPYIEIDFADHLVYPIAEEFEQGFDLDYGMLLIGEKFIMDKSAFDYIKQDKRGFLSPMANSISILKSEGLLELFDLEKCLENHKNELIKKTDALANQYGFWLESVRAQWSFLSKERGDFVHSYGLKENELINSNHFTLVNAIKKINGKIDANAINNATKIIFSKRKTFSKGEEELIIEMVKPLICHLLIHDLAKHETQSIILDWDDSKEYYDNLYIASWKNEDLLEKEMVTNSRKILNLLIPQLKPNIVDKLVKFIRNKNAVQSLRDEIIFLVNNGLSVNETWLTQYQNEILKANMKKESIMKKVRLGSSIANLGSTIVGVFIPVISLATTVITEAGSRVIENAVEKNTSTGNFDWYYAMQDNIKV
jgi:hypothetical protein